MWGCWVLALPLMSKERHIWKDLYTVHGSHFLSVRMGCRRKIVMNKTMRSQGCALAEKHQITVCGHQTEAYSETDISVPSMNQICRKALQSIRWPIMHKRGGNGTVRGHTVATWDSKDCWGLWGVWQRDIWSEARHVQKHVESVCRLNRPWSLFSGRFAGIGGHVITSACDECAAKMRMTQCMCVGVQWPYVSTTVYHYLICAFTARYIRRAGRAAYTH